MDKIIGRETEKSILKAISESLNTEFVAVYGRRRVGKTYLIKQFFDNRFTFYMTGTANVGNQQQLINFFNAYNQYKINHASTTPKVRSGDLPSAIKNSLGVRVINSLKSRTKCW